MIVAVPDDGHVSIRRDDGTETTLALADIREATLAVEWKLPQGKQGARRP
jgi:hypothetical protein